MTHFNYQISPSDNIFVTLTSQRKVILNLLRNNFHNVNEIVKSIISLTNKSTGLVHLSIRNQSQGWSINIPMFLKEKPNFPQSPKYQEVQHKGGQYLIPWP